MACQLERGHTQAVDLQMRVFAAEPAKLTRKGFSLEMSGSTKRTAAHVQPPASVQQPRPGTSHHSTSPDEQQPRQHVARFGKTNICVWPVPPGACHPVLALAVSRTGQSRASTVHLRAGGARTTTADWGSLSTTSTSPKSSRSGNVQSPQALVHLKSCFKP